MIKIILYIVSILIFTQYAYGEIGTSVQKVNWSVDTFENAKYLEFTINLHGSILTENVSIYTDRLSYGSDSKYNVKKVKKNEEKLALKLTNKQGNNIYFTNFDSSSSSNNVSKRFHIINLIIENGKIKAVVGIYIHKDLDRDVARLLLSKDLSGRDVDDSNYRINQADLNLKSASYMFYGLKNKKIGRVIRIN